MVERLVGMLRELRKEQGLSLRQLANLSGLSHSGIGHAESGENTPTLLSLLAVAEALDADLPTILSKAIEEERKKTDR